MARIELNIGDALLRRIEHEASIHGTTVDDIIRACLAARYSDDDDRPDPLDRVIGAFDGPPIDGIDRELYD